MKRTLFIGLIGLNLLLLGVEAQAQRPPTMAYQGYLTDSGGVPLDGAFTLTFRLYDALNGGAPLWTEVQAGAALVDGVLSTSLGRITSLDDVPFGQPLWLSVAVGNERAEELAPRVELRAVPYALSVRGLHVETPTHPVYGPIPNLIGGYEGNTIDPIDGGSVVVGATVGGGGRMDAEHIIRGAFATIGGGTGNTAWNTATVGGGQDNSAGSFATVGGGEGNTAHSAATVGGGKDNFADGTVSTIAGGAGNGAAGSHAAISGGQNNEAGGAHAAVGGGLENKADNNFATVGGGQANEAAEMHATVGGGQGNTARGDKATVGGGHNNAADSGHSFVGGGEDNTARSNHATIAGGEANDAAGHHAFVGGGDGNNAKGAIATVAGGNGNSADGDGASVGGGSGNAAAGTNATVPGGDSNEAAGETSFAAGHQAKALHDGAFVWADHSQSNFASTDEDQFLIRAEGGVGIGTNNPGTQLHVLDRINGSASLGNHVVLIENAATSTGSGPDVLALKTSVASPSGNVNFITFFNGADGAVGAIEGSDFGNGVTLKSGSGDFAELLPPLHPGAALRPGDVVGVFGGRVTHQTRGAEQVLVVSDRPIVLGNASEGAAGVPVAFVGQVPVRIQGPVAVGDYLMPSGLGDGTAVAVPPERMQITDHAQVIGRAWSASEAVGEGTVTVAVGLDRLGAVVNLLHRQQRDLDELRAAVDRLIALQNASLSSRE